MAWKPVYVTLEQMHDWIRLRDESDVIDDSLLTLALSASSRAVDKSAGPNRQFGKVDSPVARTYEPRWSRTRDAWVVDIDDLMDVTGFTVAVDGATVDAAGYELLPLNAAADGMPYTHLQLTSHSTAKRLIGTGLWGWDTGTDPGWPDAVTEATLLQASRLSVRRDSPYGVAGSPADGSELRLLARLDPDIEPIIAAYVRTGWVAR